MRRRLRSPLPQRDGLDAARLKLPAQGPWSTIRDHLVARLPRVPPERIDEMLRDGRIVGLDGPIGPDAPFVPEEFVWFHCDLPDEVPVPFDIGIVYRDDDLLVVDKPHFLATIPRGQHIAETALVRLRRALDLPTLSPAHRLDRATAGLLMFVVRPERRGAHLPRTVRSRIVKERGIITAQELPGPPNAETRVELVEHRGGLGRYRLVPTTGRTHQLRLHMSRLGVPIVGDDLYPVLTETALDDFTRPLQLLARELAFTDPITGVPRRFSSRLALQGWPSPADRADR